MSDELLEKMVGLITGLTSLVPTLRSGAISFHAWQTSTPTYGPFHVGTFP
jgi:hypothetical protein